ncbi:hypothetical protein HDU84_005713, partial [Entophlyctis sp. JEL0112]
MAPRRAVYALALQRHYEAQPHNQSLNPSASSLAPPAAASGHISSRRAYARADSSSSFPPFALPTHAAAASTANRNDAYAAADDPFADAGLESFSAQVKSLLRRIEQSKAQKEYAAAAQALARVVQLFELTEDADKILRHARHLRDLASAKIKGGQRVHYVARATLSIGRAQLSKNEFDNAIASFEEYLSFSGAFLTESENREVSFLAQFNLGLAYLQRGFVGLFVSSHENGLDGWFSEYKDEYGDKSCLLDYENSNKRFLSLYARFDKEKTPAEMRGDVLMNLGITFGYLGKLDKALSALEKSLIIARGNSANGSSQNPEAIARAHLNLGSLFKRAAQPEKALDHVRKELAVRREMNDLLGIAEAQYEIVTLLHEMHKYSEAMEGVQTFLEMAKRLASTDLMDKGHTLRVEISESIAKTADVAAALRDLQAARQRREGKRAEFRIILRLAGLRMELHQFKDALKDYETLDSLARGLPVSSEETDAVTFGLADSNARLGKHAEAASYFRVLVQQRWAGFSTPRRAEGLWKLADCLGKTDGSCEQIAALLIECDRIGLQLKNPQIQLEAQQRLYLLYSRFKYFSKAATASARIEELSSRVAQEEEDEEEDDDGDEDIIHQEHPNAVSQTTDGTTDDTGDTENRGGITAPDYAAISERRSLVPAAGLRGNEKQDFSGGSDAEEAQWIQRRSTTVSSSAKKKNGGRRTSAIISKLDFDSNESPIEGNAPSGGKVNTTFLLHSELISPCLLEFLASATSTKDHTAGVSFVSKGLTVVPHQEIKPSESGNSSAGSDSEEFMLSSDRTKHKRKTALDLLKRKKRLKDGSHGDENDSRENPPSRRSARRQIKLNEDVQTDESNEIAEISVSPRHNAKGSKTGVNKQRPRSRNSAGDVVNFSDANDRDDSGNDDDDDFPDLDELLRMQPPASGDIDRVVATPMPKATEVALTARTSPSRLPPLSSRIDDPPRTPVAARTRSSPGGSIKIHVDVCGEAMTIPVANDYGTPKTVRWLQSEIARRYKNMHKKT